MTEVLYASNVMDVGALSELDEKCFDFGSTHCVHFTTNAFGKGVNLILTLIISSDISIVRVIASLVLYSINCDQN